MIYQFFNSVLKIVSFCLHTYPLMHNLFGTVFAKVA